LPKNEFAVPEIKQMNIITPPCDYKPFDQSAGSSVRTYLEYDEVLNLVYVLAKFCQFVGSGSLSRLPTPIFLAMVQPPQLTASGFLSFPLVFLFDLL